MINKKNFITNINDLDNADNLIVVERPKYRINSDIFNNFINADVKILLLPLHENLRKFEKKIKEIFMEHVTLKSGIYKNVFGRFTRIDNYMEKYMDGLNEKLISIFHLLGFNEVKIILEYDSLYKSENKKSSQFSTGTKNELLEKSAVTFNMALSMILEHLSEKDEDFSINIRIEAHSKSGKPKINIEKAKQIAKQYRLYENLEELIKRVEEGQYEREKSSYSKAIEIKSLNRDSIHNTINLINKFSIIGKSIGDKELKYIFNINLKALFESKRKLEIMKNLKIIYELKRY